MTGGLINSLCTVSLVILKKKLWLEQKGDIAHSVALDFQNPAE